MFYSAYQVIHVCDMECIPGIPGIHVDLIVGSQWPSPQMIVQLSISWANEQPATPVESSKTTYAPQRTVGIFGIEKTV